MNHRAEVARQRADLVFPIYLQMGLERSLPRLAEQLKDIGAEIAVGTLKRYSGDYGWQRRLAEIDAETARRQTETGIGERLAMLDRHAQIARALLGAGGSALQSLLNDSTRLSEITPAEIARLVDLGLKAELRAAGGATDRRDMAVEIWNDVTAEMVRIFREINAEADAEARARLFVDRVDSLVTERLAMVAGKD